MVDITIGQTTFERLQRHAQPLVDTPDAVVNRALDALEGRIGEPPSEDAVEVDREVDPRRLPDLTHTKVLAARVGNEEIEKPNWNRLLERVVVRAMGFAGSFARLDRMCPANLVRGRNTDDGFHHLSEIEVSIQGLSANEACNALLETAQQTGTGLEVTFRWRAKDGAAYPTQTGRLKTREE